MSSMRRLPAQAVAPACLLACLVVPSTASAHARWFLEPGAPLSVVTLPGDRLACSMIAGAFLVAAALVLLTALAVRQPGLGRILVDPWTRSGRFEWQVLAAVFGATLVVASLSREFLAPNLRPGTGALADAALFAQAIVGALLFAQARGHAASLALMALVALGFALFGATDMVDYAFEAGGLALALHILSRPGPAAPEGRDAKAVIVLRVALGAQLAVLAAHDKLVDPGVSLAFVDAHPIVNVPALLGMPGFTNLHFVMGAGLAEVTFGALLVAGIATRFIAGVLAGLFVLTGALFGLAETVGHLPIIAMAVLLVLRGGRPAPVESLVARPTVAWTAGTATATAFALLIVALSPPAATAAMRAASLRAAATGPDPSMAVPAALFARFETGLRRSGRVLPADIQVEAAWLGRSLAGLGGAGLPDKSQVARALFDVYARYAALNGEDDNALWLRFSYLAGACTPEELALFRATVGDASWENQMDSAPEPLRSVLVGIARQAAAALLGYQVRLETAAEWQAAAQAAPDSGPLYAQTHTLAAVSRILVAAGRQR